jgi:putative ABC transport system permease protein
VSGVEPEFNQLRTIPIAEGRFISPEDERTAARVCIIGEDVKKQLFGNRLNMLGTVISINSLPFRVVGMLANKDQNSSYSGMDEKKIFMPYSTMARDVPPKTYYVPGFLNEILYRPRSLDDYETAQDQVKRVIARAHGFDPRDKSALGIWDTVEDQQQVAEIFDSMTLFLAFIALVTLSLGGIGVMNIMLVTVSERTREIGLRKALGATRSRILADFLAEGCALAFASGAVGWAVAFGLSSLLKLFPMPAMFPGLPVSESTTAAAFGALAVIAIVSAIVPAWKAASLTPVEALRYER